MESCKNTCFDQIICGRQAKDSVMENLHTLLLELIHSSTYWPRMSYLSGYNADANTDVNYSMLAAVQSIKKHDLIFNAIKLPLSMIIKFM